MLKGGRYYIISAYAQTDGSLLVLGSNSSLMLKYNNKDKIFSSDEYKKYEKAFKNEKKTNRERSKSRYEE